MAGRLSAMAQYLMRNVEKQSGTISYDFLGKMRDQSPKAGKLTSRLPYAGY